MTLRRLFIQAAWTPFKGLRPNASSENAREHLIEDLHGVQRGCLGSRFLDGYIHNLFGDLLADNHRQ